MLCVFDGEITQHTTIRHYLKETHYWVGLQKYGRTWIINVHNVLKATHWLRICCTENKKQRTVAADENRHFDWQQIQNLQTEFQHLMQLYPCSLFWYFILYNLFCTYNISNVFEFLNLSLINCLQLINVEASYINLDLYYLFLPSCLPHSRQTVHSWKYTPPYTNVYAEYSSETHLSAYADSRSSPFIKCHIGWHSLQYENGQKI